MSKETEPVTPETTPVTGDPESSDEREYEQSGLYPSEGKSFRIVALLGSLFVVVVLIAVSAFVLDRVLI